MKRKHIIAVTLLLCVIVPFCLLPIGAVSVGGYETPVGDTFKQSSKLDNAFGTNTPMQIAWITDLTSGQTDNLTMQTDNQFNVTELSYNHSTSTLIYDRADSNYVYRGDVDGINTNESITWELFDNTPRYAQEQVRLNTEPLDLFDKEGNVEAQYPYVSIHRASPVGIRNQNLGTGGIYPYGIMLSARNLTLCPQLYDYLYMSPEYFGYAEPYGSIGGNSGIGGLLVKTYESNTYSSATIRCEINYTNWLGQKGYWTSENKAASDFYNPGYTTYRIPLIFTEFMEAHKDEAVIYIDNVNVTFYSPYSYINTISQTNTIFVVDSCNITTTASQWQTMNYDFDISVISVIQSHYLRENIDPVFLFHDWSYVTAWLGSAVGGIFDMELGYGVTLGGIFVILFGFSFVMWFLKHFAGG